MTDKKRGAAGIRTGGFLVLIVFTVLCLTMFTTLSLASADSDRKLTEKSLAHITEYYQADVLAVERLAEIDRLLESVSSSADSEAVYREKLQAELGDGFDMDVGEYTFLVPLHGEQFLRARLCCLYPGEEGNYRILEWRTENRQEYEIDETLPVWTGE